VNVRLTEDQVALLRRVLTNHLSDLRMEIADTDDQPLRDSLKRDEALIVGLLRQLGEDLGVGQDLLRGLA
jgi:hypothetical protein